MIVGQDGQAGSAVKAFLRDPSADRLGPAVKLGVGAAFDLIVTLQFQGRVVRPALGAFHKSVIERGHGSWGIYTKIGWGRSILPQSSVYQKFRVRKNRAARAETTGRDSVEPPATHWQLYWRCAPDSLRGWGASN